MTNMPPDLEARLERLTEVMRLNAGKFIPIDLEITAAYMIVMQLQIALRHPDNVGETAETARRFALMIQQRDWVIGICSAGQSIERARLKSAKTWLYAFVGTES